MAPSVPQPPQEVGTSSQKHASNTRATKLPLPPAAPRDDKPQIDWAGLRPPARLVRPAARSAAQEGKGHSPEPKIDPDPPAHSPVAPRPPVLPPPVKDKIYSKQEPAQMLDSPALPEWIRALASFNVLGSPVIIGGLSDYEQQPFWATRVAALKHVPPLFEAIKHVKTQDGDRPHLGRCYLCSESPHQKEGKVTIATGQDSTYKELETPTKVHGLVGACFSRMWMEPSLAKHFPSYEEFNLVATTISTGYNEVAKTAGLPTRMLKLLPTARGTAPPKRMRIDHKGDKDDKVSPAQTTPAAAASSTQSASSSSKRPQQQKDEDQAGKRHRDSAQPQPHTNQSAWDWDWRWQSWSRHGYETGSQPWPRNHRLHWPQLDTASLCLEDGATRVITRQISNLAPALLRLQCGTAWMETTLPPYAICMCIYGPSRHFASYCRSTATAREP